MPLISRLNRLTHHYQYPVSPWQTCDNESIPNFPRYGKYQSKNSVSLSEDQFSFFWSNWQNAFRCLYQNFRQSELPYFYACSEMFTILFRENHVVLWPATKKLKE